MIIDLNDLLNCFDKCRFKSSPSPPPVPDPSIAIEQQGVVNKETAIAQAFLNNVNQTNPFGSVEFEAFKDPNTDLDRFRSTTTLNPQSQAAFDAEQAVTRGTNELAAGQIGRIEEAVQDPFSFEGLPAPATANAAERQRIEDELFGRFSSRLNTRFDEEEDQLRNLLNTRGIALGSEASDRALEQFGRTKNDAFQGATAQSIAGAGAEQALQFGQQRQERENAIQEEAFLRNIPLNEISALLGTGSLGIPQFGGPAQTQIGQTDVLGANALSNQIAQSNFAQQSASANAFNSGLFGLGSAGISSIPFFL